MPPKSNQVSARDLILHRTQPLPATAALSLFLQGCTLHGAPSYEIFGAYFPLWLVSALIGFVGGLIAHRIFVSTGYAQIVPFQLFVCLAIGVMVAVLFWLAGTGHLL
ncbi:YtcA family lipoprotein [Caballeronia sp. dw_276]|uniref:YtcA family lipoprotein n=1 Tax=Caballeronia sp. dw_276 TaxID=2719795 RepID=UPI001BD2CCE6|nr:YtcA family lipoprotein [Caballeronia sp. dw_276]